MTSSRVLLASLTYWPMHSRWGVMAPIWARPLLCLGHTNNVARQCAVRGENWDLQIRNWVERAAAYNVLSREWALLVWRLSSNGDRPASVALGVVLPM